MPLIVKDSDLNTIDELTDRINSISKQIDIEDGRDLNRIKDMDKYRAKVIKLNERKENLWCRRAKLMKQQGSYK